MNSIKNKISLVMTTINTPKNTSFFDMSRVFDIQDIFIVGDTKTPDSDWKSIGCNYSTVDEQNSEFPELSNTPLNSYSRKNFGYLQCIKAYQTDFIFETDDDNYPYQELTVESILNSRFRQFLQTSGESTWINIYKYFTDQFIWPRGLPLEYINTSNAQALISSETNDPPCLIQFLADGDPDVDAVFRLLFSHETIFKKDQNIRLSKRHFCPFNSQNTLWHKKLYPLLYLPSFVSFRMCDIWRSFIALRCIHELELGIQFSSPTLYQKRNIHNLKKDFDQEIVGYKNNDLIVKLLSQIKFSSSDLPAMLIQCYEHLNLHTSLIEEQEVELVKNWCKFF